MKTMEIYSSRKNLVQVAKLYYVAGMSQEEIASIMSISRSKVSRMLSLAKELKVVQITVSEYPSLQNELECKLAGHFGLAPVIVVPSAPTVQQSKKRVGETAAKLLSYYIEDNMSIGIVWGSTADCMVDAFEWDPNFEATNIKCVQLCGGLHLSNSIADGREIVRRLANKIGGESVLLQYPLIMKNPKLVEMIQTTECADYFEQLKKLDIALITMGSSEPEESASYLGGYITKEESNELIANGYAADICGHRLTRDGKPADTILSGRVLSIPLEDLKNVPTVIGMGAGKGKVQSMIAAVKGGYVTGLVMDEVAAITIVQQEKI